GTRQHQYIVSDPTILNRFPSVPPIETLASFAVPQTITRVADRIEAPYVVQSSFSIERSLPANVSVGATYVKTDGFHSIRSRDINAPLPGGGRPFGNVGEIFQYETTGRSRQNQLLLNFFQRVEQKLSYYVTYVLNSSESDTDNVGNPADSYN